MKHQHQREIVVVYTKQFPFGFKEAYILDELNALNEAFDEVYFLPYAEFNFQPSDLRIALNEQFQVVPFLNQRETRSWSDKFRACLSILSILFNECFFSREKMKSIARLKQNFLRLYHYSSISEKLKIWLSTKDGNITHYHYWMHDGVMIEKMARGAKSGRRIARAHSIDCYHKDWPLLGYAPYEKQKLAYLDQVYSVSKHGEIYLKKTFPHWTYKFQYQPLGIPVIPHPIRSNPQPIILTIAFMGKVKNMDRMVDLMQVLKNDFKWIHIGSGVEKIQRDVEARCQSLGIPFQTLGYLTKEEIFEFLENNSVAFFANTSIWEGVPVSLMEAGMFGIPFIVSDIPGNLEIVNKDNGFVIPLKGDLLPFAEQIRSSYQDKENWQKLAKSAQLKILKDYNAEINHRSFFQKIKGLPLK